MRPVYQMSGLAVVREKAGERFTLEVPEFTAGTGEFIAVLGTSGCGKSTLLDLLGLLLPPSTCQQYLFHSSRGKIVDLSLRPSSAVVAGLRRSEIGYVLQHGGLLPFLTVRQNAELPLHLNGVRDSTAVTHLLDKLGILDQAGKLPHHLSGGQRQRAAIARALALQPPVILCDEPTAAVDRLTAMEIISLLQDLSRSLGVTLIVVTHAVELVRGRADRTFGFHLDRAASGAVVSTCYETTGLER
jgi:putative ABC transport system ATP-binding protein